MPENTQPEFADLASQLLYNSEVRLVGELLTLADCDSGEAVSRPCRP